MESKELVLRLSNDLEEISRVADAIESHAAKENWPDAWVFNLNLSLDELITNIVHNGYSDEEQHEIRLSVAEGDGVVEVVLEDDGRSFDPFTEAPDPILTGGVEERPIGGLGVHLVKTLMHEVEYERRGDLNRVVLRLRRED